MQGRTVKGMAAAQVDPRVKAWYRYLTRCCEADGEYEWLEPLAWEWLQLELAEAEGEKAKAPAG